MYIVNASWLFNLLLKCIVGLLHRFKSEKQFRHTPLKPDTTMFIPESTVLVNPTSQLLELKGKALGGMFGGGSKRMFEFSSENHDVIKQWIAILGPMAIQQETKVINTPVPVADNVDNRSIHSKVLAAEDDHDQAGPSKLDPNAASTNENAAHNTNNDTLKQAPAESSENAAAAVAGAAAVAAGSGAAAATPELNPITNVPSHLADNETVSTDDDDDFRRQTIEYSTHSPISETPPPATTNVDEHNPFVNMNNNSKDSVDKEGTASSATTSPATPTNISYTNNNTTTANGAMATNDAKPPRGPTREGSELYWDTNTTPLHTTSSYLG